jgi:hypothetical protein
MLDPMGTPADNPNENQAFGGRVLLMHGIWGPLFWPILMVNTIAIAWFALSALLG